jgi:hypothetical protein
MAIYELAKDGIEKISETSFGKSGVKERADLQRLLREQIEVVAPDTLVIAEEFGDWVDSKRRIDLLGLDKDANLIVFELKRTRVGGHMELQAIRYAAMVSALTAEKVVDIFEHYLRSHEKDGDPRAIILEFLEWDELDEDQFAQEVRIVLVSADFSRELTTAVIWLNERDLDIRCVRIKPYKEHRRILIDVQKIIQLPDSAVYLVNIT